jgi:hypothetical protein
LMTGSAKRFATNLSSVKSTDVLMFAVQLIKLWAEQVILKASIGVLLFVIKHFHVESIIVQTCVILVTVSLASGLVSNLFIVLVTSLNLILQSNVVNLSQLVGDLV